MTSGEDRRRSRPAGRADAAAGLGDWLRATRARQAITQRALAQRAGMSRSYLCDIERGRGARPSVETLGKLAIALGVARSEVLRAAGVIEQPAGMTGDAGERRLVALYRDLSRDGQAALERFARFLHEEEHRFVQPTLLVDPAAEAQPAPVGPTLFDLSALAGD